MNDFVAHPNSFLEKHNDIYISKNDIDVLKKYNIFIDRYKDLNSLLFDIENILNEECYGDLEGVSISLSEYNYYNNTNK